MIVVFGSVLRRCFVEKLIGVQGTRYETTARSSRIDEKLCSTVRVFIIITHSLKLFEVSLKNAELRS
jgi:hypothetical protein